MGFANNIRHLLKWRYQPLEFPWFTIPKSKNSTIMSADVKVKFLKLPPLKGKTFVDIGCAEGYYVRHAVMSGADYAIGIDIQPMRLFIARFMAKFWGMSDKCEFINSSKPYSCPQADVVICLSVNHHLPHRFGQFQDLILSHLAPGGIAVIEYVFTGLQWCASSSMYREVKWYKFKKSELICVTQRLPMKDRVLYHVYN